MSIYKSKSSVFLIVSLVVFSLTLSLYLLYWTGEMTAIHGRYDFLEISDINISRSGGVLTINFTVQDKGAGNCIIKGVAVEWNSTLNKERMFFRYSTSTVINWQKNATFSLDFPAGMFHSNQTVLIDIYTDSTKCPDYPNTCSKEFYTPHWHKYVLIP